MRYCRSHIDGRHAMRLTLALSTMRLVAAGALLALSACATVEAPLIRAKMIGCPRPVYPRDALRNEQTGTTTLLFRVGTDGLVHDTKVVKSSGHPSLDQAAMVLNACRFVPATRGGKPVESSEPIQFVWTLE